MTTIAERPTIDRTATTTARGEIATPAETPREKATREKATRFVLAGLRLALGWTFLWAFLDKTFGLGHETTTAQAWVNGGSPTKGFLGHAVAGPFADLYRSFAGAAWADWLFMLGLAAIGTALVLGIGTRIAAVAGALLLVMMWTAVLPPENNPFMDDHLIYAGVLAVLALTAAGDTLGLGRYWARLPLVRRLPVLK
ncbi:DoxX family membrane protein [Micromonospora globbae]|uniref:DoxX family membrane protein n=1 Tax=Micromonospora globbae TaxID=1894969 RepID=A0A420EU21_9ACTN|nr:DoxX family membrane protein [Micromonospora globbae]RKF24216.1 DoxX family membrane protein [Micromonospora globbae]